MRIGILNAGNIGRLLARAWLGAGHDVMLAKDGRQDKLEAFIATHPAARRGTPSQVATYGEVVLFSVYWSRLDATLSESGLMPGKIVIDTMNPLRVDDDFHHTHDRDFMARSSTTEQLQTRCPDARVVKAFSSMPSTLLDIDRWRGAPTLPPVFIAGDDAHAKSLVSRLASDVGFPTLDAGPAHAARSIEQLGVLLHQVGEHQFSGAYDNLAPALLTAPQATTEEGRPR